MCKVKYIPDPTPRQIENLWAKIDRRSDDECWLWTGVRNTCAYGNFRCRVIGGHRTKGGLYPQIRPHRIVALLYGILEEDLLIDHICKTPLCCNPSHLRAATPSQNNRYKAPSGSSKYTGVTWEKNRRKWKAQVRADGTVITIGRFYCEKEAARAYNEYCLSELPACDLGFANLNDLGEEG